MTDVVAGGVPTAPSCNGRAGLRQVQSMERDGHQGTATSLKGSLEDPQAFEAAFTAKFPSVHRFLARRIGSPLADDLAAETFAVAFRRRGSFDPSLGELQAWLF